MKRVVFEIFALGLLLIGCKNLPENRKETPKSDFNFIKDYADFQKRINDLDTLVVWIDLSGCTFQESEKLTITKSNDSIDILIEKREGMDSSSEWINQRKFKIAVDDTTWGFGKFLSRNSYRFLNGGKKFGTLVMYYKSDKLHFFTDGLVDKNMFLVDYYKTMFRIDSSYRDHFIEEIEIIEEEPY